jgi:hypothetical protein
VKPLASSSSSRGISPIAKTRVPAGHRRRIRLAVAEMALKTCAADTGTPMASSFAANCAADLVALLVTKA